MARLGAVKISLAAESVKPGQIGLEAAPLLGFKLNGS